MATGVQAFLTTPRWADAPGEEADRAAFANRTGADLFVSLALDASTNPDACGVSTYFFGDANRDTWSSVGERFAGLVQREIVARSDLVDLRSHPKTWELLRHTRMPAVRLDAGYLTNAGDAPGCATPTFRDVLAEAIVVSVQRFYLSPEVDAHTGVLRVSEIRDSLPGRLTPSFLSRSVVTRGPARAAALRHRGAARACPTRRRAAAPDPARAPRGWRAWCAGPSASAG